jgi:ATP-dependent Lon protease
MAILRIPLFPLNLVLFPGNTLPLHIFEARYKQMIRSALDHHTPFGIVLAKENGIARFGCMAEVTQLLKTYEDGRMDIETVGLLAFRIDEVHRENPLLEATVESLEDGAAPEPIDMVDAAELFDLYGRCHALLHGGTPTPIDNLPGTSLSYQIAGRLPLGHDVLQELLEIRAETARRAALAERLREFIPQLAGIRYNQAKASGNGHGPN